MLVSNDPRVDKEIRSLDKKDNSRVVKLIELFRDYGFVLTEPYLKKLRVNLWELRSGRWRLLLGMVKDKAIIVDIFSKKTQKTPKKKIEKALRRLKEYS